MYAHKQAIHVEKNIFDFGNGYIGRHGLGMAGIEVCQTPVTHSHLGVVYPVALL